MRIGTVFVGCGDEWVIGVFSRSSFVGGGGW